MSRIGNTFRGYYAILGSDVWILIKEYTFAEATGDTICTNKDVEVAFENFIKRHALTVSQR